MKWYNFETLWSTLKEGLRALLIENNIQFEISGCGRGWHFEILCGEKEVNLINDWLDQNTITEVR